MRSFARHASLESSVALTKPYTKCISFPQSKYEKELRYWFKPSDNPLIIFLHGLGCSKMDFAHALAHLPNYSLLALDFPYCGKKLTIPDDFTNVNFCDISKNTHEAVSHILLEEGSPMTSYFLVGHSMGAKIGVHYARQFGSKISGFCNNEGHLHKSDPKAAAKLLESDDFDDTIERVSNMDTYWATSLEIKSSSTSFQSYAQAIAENNGNSPNKLFEEFLDLKVPKLYMYGEYTEPKIQHTIEIFQNHEIEMRKIPSTSHFSLIEDPKAFYGALDSWILSLS